MDCGGRVWTHITFCSSQERVPSYCYALGDNPCCPSREVSRAAPNICSVGPCTGSLACKWGRFTFHCATFRISSENLSPLPFTCISAAAFSLFFACNCHPACPLSPTNSLTSDDRHREVLSSGHDLGQVTGQQDNGVKESGMGGSNKDWGLKAGGPLAPNTNPEEAQ